MRRYYALIVLTVLMMSWSCEKKAPVEIQLSEPTLAGRSLPAAISQHDSAAVFFMVKVQDPQGLDNVQQVEIFLNQQNQTVSSGLMWDDGNNGDIIAYNGTFTYTIIPKESSLIPGDLQVSFLAHDADGHSSAELCDTVLVVGDSVANTPPQVLAVSAPDTISRSSQATYLMTATVTDQQGLSDITRVFFNSFRPNGSPATGNPFSMYDTGINGDAQQGDGVYSFQFSISPSNDLGDYRFEIQAQDKANSKSNIMIKIVTVVE